MDQNQTNSIFPPIPFILVNGLSAGIVPIYMTSFPAFNTNPSSWIVMGLQEQSLTLNILIENQEMVLVIQKSFVLAQIVSESRTSNSYRLKGPVEANLDSTPTLTGNGIGRCRFWFRSVLICYRFRLGSGLYQLGSILHGSVGITGWKPGFTG